MTSTNPPNDAGSDATVNDIIVAHALVVAAGKGNRFGTQLPKQYLKLHGKSILEHSLCRLSESAFLSQCTLVVAADDGIAPTLDFAMPVSLCTGGEERWQSVARGVAHIAQAGADAHDLIVIHDAARPLVTATDIDAVIRAASVEAYGAILAVPVADTLKQVHAAYISTTLDRRKLWQAQTPQVFRLGQLQRVLEMVAAEQWSITDEASAFERCGLAIRVVEGRRDNLKLTYPSDRQMIAQLLSAADDAES